MFLSIACCASIETICPRLGYTWESLARGPAPKPVQLTTMLASERREEKSLKIKTQKFIGKVTGDFFLNDFSA